jgi:hypothetical protein
MRRRSHLTRHGKKRLALLSKHSHNLITLHQLSKKSVHD